MKRRVRLSVVATLAGWLAGTLLTLFFELPEVWRNAYPADLAHDMVLGFALWVAFTLAVCSVVWCVVVLPLTLLFPAEWIVHHRWRIAPAASTAGVFVVGWKIGTWHDLGGNGPSNPILMPLFLEYAGFAVLLASVTTLVYARLLSSGRRAIQY